MRYVAAYLLATLGGTSFPTADDIKKILSSVGIDAVDENVNKVISELKGKNLEQVMAAGKKMDVACNNRRTYVALIVDVFNYGKLFFRHLVLYSQKLLTDSFIAVEKKRPLYSGFPCA